MPTQAFVSQVVTRGVTKVLSKLGKNVSLKMVATMAIAQRMVANTAKANYLSGPRPDRLGVQTGRLRRSIATPPPKVTPTGVEGEVGTNVVYAAIHEFGGTIRPKTSQYLAIPAKGVKGSPRDFADTFVRESKTGSGNKVILQGDGSGGVKLLFTLVDEVTIPARPFLNPALNDNRALIRSLFAKRVAKMVSDSLK